MCELTVEFWRRALGLPVERFQAAVLKKGFWPTTVYRVQLDYTHGTAPRSLILKCAEPYWNGDAFGAEREYRVYTELLPHIPITQPKRYFATLGSDTEHTQIALRDLDDEYFFPPETHMWTWAQAQAILRTYATLHVTAAMQSVADRTYLMPRLCERWTRESGWSMFADLLREPGMATRLHPVVPLVHAVLEELPDLERVIAGEPLTLVHYDAYPPNIAFARHNPQADAVLIDWALASCDLGETDLAFLFQQPYGSDRLLDWRKALRYYYEVRGRLTGCGYDWDERVMVFRYARIEALFTTLVPIHRAWQKAVREDKPFGPDAPDPFARYYDTALTNLVQILQELGEPDSTYVPEGKED